MLSSLPSGIVLDVESVISTLRQSQESSSRSLGERRRLELRLYSYHMQDCREQLDATFSWLYVNIT